MDIVFNELKQFIIREITEKNELEKQLYYNWVENKKYLIIYNGIGNKNSITPFSLKFGTLFYKNLII